MKDDAPAATRESILPLQGLEVGYSAGDRWLLVPTDFTIAAGGLTAILGANGAGKSLLLRLCHGLIKPSLGSIVWNAPGGVLDGRKRHAMVFQKPVMLRRSARANLVHALKAAGDRDADARADEALRHFGLMSYSNAPARLLSGGEQQRLAIARAWALRPEIMFLDEPTSQLDPGATRQIEEMISAMKREGVTIVMATHDLGQARRLADRVLYLHKGAILEDTTGHRFFQKPMSQTAQAFIAGDLLW
ncbi:MAG: ATP-binding cassette domain-containing protein [Beijerinckiaceae bacterium]|nr:ATP-binding cassette domain-containing protein [Beijerinckiaceae bacterium]